MKYRDNMPFSTRVCHCLHKKLTFLLFIKMFKLFFVITLCSAVLLWYCHEFHSAKFMEVLEKIPYANAFASQIYFYLSSPLIPSGLTSTKVFTSDELKQYNGENDKGPYLAILGEVYDVSKGQKHYGPGGSYHVFAGRDASRSFITGDFVAKDSLDHVLDLSLDELLSLRDWLKFYKREYEYKGKLAGRFFDGNGKGTKYYKELQDKFNEAEKSKKVQKDEELLFPPCNVEWNAETGTKVWCTNKSGGIQRPWSGVPRKLYMVGTESYRCACINMDLMHKKDSPQYARRGHLQQYDNCDPMNDACFLKE